MRILIIFFLIFSNHILTAQASSEENRSFLTILVIPYSKLNENKESIDLIKDVINQINRIIEERGFRTKDYESILRIPNINIIDLGRTEIKEAIKNAKPDVVIYTEIKTREFPEGDRQLQLKVQAVDQYSAENYANNISIESTRRRFIDFNQAASEAQFISQLNGFANQLERKFADIIKNGRTVTVKISIRPNSKIKLGTIVDNSDLDLIGTVNQWIKTRSLSLYPPSGDNEYWQIECKIPIFDKNMQTITPFSLRSDLKIFLGKLRFTNLPLTIEDVTINSLIGFVLGSSN